jgi:ATP synthase protein I
VYNDDWMAVNRPIPESNKPPGGSGGMHSLVEAEKLMQIAFLLPSAVLVGWGIGALANSHWHQKWMVAVGLILGCVAGLMSVIRVAFAAERATSKSDNADAGNDAGSGTKQ